MMALAALAVLAQGKWMAVLEPRPPLSSSLFCSLLYHPTHQFGLVLAGIYNSSPPHTFSHFLTRGLVLNGVQQVGALSQRPGLPCAAHNVAV